MDASIPNAWVTLGLSRSSVCHGPFGGESVLEFDVAVSCLSSGTVHNDVNSRTLARLEDFSLMAKE